jgi:hypothetical protein
MPLLKIKEVATQLGISAQTLKYWLVANPVDVDGVPLYIPIGRRWKFEERDIARILDHMRVLESTRLGFSIKAKARLAGLMSKVGNYDHAAAVVEAAERRKNAPKAPVSFANKLIAEMAVESVLGPRRKPPQRRVTLPRRRPSSD